LPGVHGITADRPASKITRATEPSRRSEHWFDLAACRRDGAPDMFADQWGVGRDGRRRRSAALATCRACPVRSESGRAALAEIAAGLVLSGVRCGVEFTDVTPSRQSRDVDRLRLVVARLDQGLRAGPAAPTERCLAAVGPLVVEPA